MEKPAFSHRIHQQNTAKHTFDIKDILTIDCKLCPVGVVRAKMIGDHTLVAALISEVDIEEMKHSGVDQLSLLVLGIVLQLCVVEHLSILPPSRGHRRVAAAGGHAAQSDVVPP